MGTPERIAGCVCSNFLQTMLVPSHWEQELDGTEQCTNRTTDLNDVCAAFEHGFERDWTLLEWD